jgi:outer membrane protein OmpA-like peptidoglycan-associated protein
MPAGILLEGIMGFDNLSGIAEKIAVGEHPRGEEKKRYRWVLPVIIILVAGGAIWYFMYRQPVPETQQQPVTDTVVTPKDTVSAAPIPDNSPSVKLPDGTILSARKGGIEDQLLIFFNDPSGKPSRRFQFNFDQLSFNNETSVITNESMVQIQNIASILKVFPKAKIKIGGFNEKGGDSVANRTLSENRATAVAAAIKAAGANAKQIVGVEGFGSDFAKYSGEAADSLREKDKRISISVRNK